MLLGPRKGRRGRKGGGGGGGERGKDAKPRRREQRRRLVIHWILTSSQPPRVISEAQTPSEVNANFIPLLRYVKIYPSHTYKLIPNSQKQKEEEEKEKEYGGRWEKKEDKKKQKEED